MFGALLGIGSKIIDKLFPNKEEAQKYKLRLLKLQESGELKALDAQMQMIKAEAESSDKWTSRARPSFLYVMYAMILAAFPMGILHAFNPQMATSIATGMKEWLAAIPTPMWALFGVGYLGYTMKRSKDKQILLESLTKMGS